MPLTDGDVGVVDDGRILHIAEAAIDRHTHLNVLRAGDVVVGHEDIGKPAAVESGVGRHPHAVVAADLLRVHVGRPESITTVV